VRANSSFALVTFLVILTGGFVVCAAGDALGETWRTYRNDRYGTTIDYPDYFTPGNPPEIDDGLSFGSSDGAGFSVFASYNALDFDLGGYQDFIMKNLAAGKVVTYRAHGDNWFAISGTSEPVAIFYERYLLSHGGEMTEGFVMTYPARLKQKYDPIIADGEIVQVRDWFSDAGQALMARPASLSAR
jgi:hypothetical protein